MKGEGGEKGCQLAAKLDKQTNGGDVMQTWWHVPPPGAKSSCSTNLCSGESRCVFLLCCS